jgi:hypothetical protein
MMAWVVSSKAMAARPTTCPDRVPPATCFGQWRGAFSAHYAKHFFGGKETHLHFRRYPEEAVPEHATLSKNGHGCFRDSDALRHVFEPVSSA